MISKRALAVDSSGIRRVFDLAANLKDPINLSIGQPVFGASDAVKEAAIEAIRADKSGYTQTQGIFELRSKIAEKYQGKIGPDQDVFVTCGVSAGILLSYMSILDPGDEILIPDPFFCMYRDLALLIHATPVYYDTYPSFALNAATIEPLITPKTKAILVNTPGNPTGYACSEQELAEVIELARRYNLVVLYDEIYDAFSYDQPHPQCLGNYERVVLLNGFSKTAGVPGWRVGYVVGPKELVQQMLKLQQYTFVCANSASQWAMLAALPEKFDDLVVEYRKKRDFIVDALHDHYSFVTPGGAFYLFPEAPGGSGQQFVERAIAQGLLIVPGSVFSRRDTHFRISFSASQSMLERGVEVLVKLAKEF